jgi:hypothetical protein
LLADITQIFPQGATEDDIPLIEPYKIMFYVKECILEHVLPIVDPSAKENEITYKIVKSTQLKNDTPWMFNHQSVESNNNRSEDIGVSLKASRLTEDFFKIEAKRLNSFLHSKEYVVGNGGGIERFKRCHHASNHKIAGMIGYVQTDDFDKWETKINGWIDEEIASPPPNELIWRDEDKLVPKMKNEKSVGYESLHSRIHKEEEIQLLHLWITFC